MSKVPRALHLYIYERLEQKVRWLYSNAGWTTVQGVLIMNKCPHDVP